MSWIGPMEISSRTPEGEANRCAVCGNALRIDPSRPPGAPCPRCGSLVWFPDSSEVMRPEADRKTSLPIPVLAVPALPSTSVFASALLQIFFWNATICVLIGRLAGSGNCDPYRPWLSAIGLSLFLHRRGWADLRRFMLIENREISAFRSLIVFLLLFVSVVYVRWLVG